MLRIEPIELVLTKHDKQKIMRLTNTQPHRVIFKIKTTNIEATNAFPTSGTLEQNQTMEIVVKVLVDKELEAKMMVMCMKLEGDHKPAQNIWSVASRTDISTTIVKIKKRLNLDTIKEEDTISKFSQHSSHREFPKISHCSIQEKHWQKKYQEEVNISSRLRQKLQIAEQKLLETTRWQQQSRINLSVKNGTEEYYSVTMTNIILTCLLSFLLGYVFARFY